MSNFLVDINTFAEMYEDTIYDIWNNNDTEYTIDEWEEICYAEYCKGTWKKFLTSVA